MLRANYIILLLFSNYKNLEFINFEYTTSFLDTSKISRYIGKECIQKGINVSSREIRMCEGNDVFKRRLKKIKWKKILKIMTK